MIKSSHNIRIWAPHRRYNSFIGSFCRTHLPESMSMQSGSIETPPATAWTAPFNFRRALKRFSSSTVSPKCCFCILSRSYARERESNVILNSSFFSFCYLKIFILYDLLSSRDGRELLRWSVDYLDWALAFLILNLWHSMKSISIRETRAVYGPNKKKINQFRNIFVFGNNSNSPLCAPCWLCPAIVDRTREMVVDRTIVRAT